MRILNKEVELKVNKDGEFTRETLKALVKSELVYTDSGSVYFYSQKHDAYIFSGDIHRETIDEVVMTAIEKILSHEVSKHSPYSIAKKTDSEQRICVS